MILELKRYKLTNESTIGRLYVDGIFQCYTLEDRYRPGQPKVAGETCIPCGTYEIVINESPRFSKIAGHPVFMPRLLDVLGFLGILIHVGNRKEDTDGCILVGNTVGTDVIGESKLAYAALFSKLQDALGRGEKISIKVTVP